jgi:hypothetical protein
MYVHTTDAAIQMMKDAQQNIIDSKSYDALLQMVVNDRRGYYILMIGILLITLVVLFNLVSVISKLDANVFAHPDRYEVVRKEEADAIKYLKYELLKLRFIKEKQFLDKEVLAKYIVLGKDSNNIPRGQ